MRYSRPGCQSPQRKYAGYFIHDIKEGEGVGQQEQEGDKRDDEERDEVKGEVEEIRSNAHYMHDYENGAFQCMMTHALASTTLTSSTTCFRSLHTLLEFSFCASCPQFNFVAVPIFIQFLTCTRIPCRDSHCENGSSEVLSSQNPTFRVR